MVLALEASGESASAAVMAGGGILAEARHEARHGHAERMLVLVEDCLGEANMTMAEVTALVAGRGPGSFTGTRVALAAAKGLMLARSIEGFGLPSLEALAHAARAAAPPPRGEPPRPVAALADTRRRSVFLGRYSPDGGAMGGMRILDREEVAPALARQGRSWIVTGGEVATAPEFDWRASLEAGGLDATLVPLAPSAGQLCRLFADKLAAGAVADCPLEPLYLSEPLLGPAGAGAS